MNGKRALVTGSARGIGRAIALELARQGYEILIHCASNIEKARQTQALIEDLGGKSQIVIADLCDLAQTKQLCKQMGDVDVLVLNASLQYRTPWEEITLDACQEQLNCNFVSSFLLIQAAVPNMKKQGWGRIVTIGSVQEKKPHPDMLIYSSSKCAQTSMTQSLALQLAPFGITVNNVAPGVINTDRNAQALADKEYTKIVKASIPLGFYGEPEDCAALVGLLCSQQGRYITGQSIYVDGGKSVQ